MCDDCRQRGKLGFTLIELTVVLAVIVTLALVLTPSIANIINDSRMSRARSDSQTIADAIVRFYRDNGFFPLWPVSAAGGPGRAADRLELLVSPGNVPLEENPTAWSLGTSGALADQLMRNTPGYALSTPRSQFGWNGPYLSSEFGSDPCGNRYVVNIGLVDSSAGVQTTGGLTKAAVYVLSAGPNGTIETPFSQGILSAILAGDDIGQRIQ